MVGDKLVAYAAAVLGRMIHEADADGVWEGRATDIVNELGGGGYYSRIISLLYSSGAIEMMQRGGGGTPSKFKILDPNADIGAGESDPSILRRKRTVLTRIEDLERLVGGIDVPQALAELKKAIDQKAIPPSVRKDRGK